MAVSKFSLSIAVSALFSSVEGLGDGAGCRFCEGAGTGGRAGGNS